MFLLLKYGSFRENLQYKIKSMIGTGRPHDSAIQVEFMRKLRGPKLQFINAESQLQIFLAMMEKKDEKNKNKVTTDDILQFLKPHLEADKMKQLLQIIEEAQKAWKFTDIKDANEFPPYLFDDESDPAYWIDAIKQKKKSQEFTFTCQILFFIELICLVKREQITPYILGKYKEDYDNIMSLMKIAEQKIQQKKDLPLPSGQSANDEYNRREDDQSFNEDKQDSNEDEASSSNVSGKRKKIKKDKKKPTKAGGKKGKTSREESEEAEQDQGDNPTENIEDEKKLALRTVNHIAWAYFYIISSPPSKSPS